MHNVQETEARTTALKKKLGSRVAIVGHHYQRDEIVKFCDIVGDSLELIAAIPKLEARYIVFCGVSFMGETAAMLARDDQLVVLPTRSASSRTVGMPSMEQLENTLTTLKERGHSFLPLVYVNSSIQLKALAGAHGGALCTSSNLRRMLQWAYRQSAHVLFVPDRNLGRNTASQMRMSPDDLHVLQVDGNGIDMSVDQPLDRHLLLWPGYCRIHEAYTPAMVNSMRFAYPGCRITVHSEATPEVVALADATGPTSFLIHDALETAKDGRTNVLVIGTELNLVHRLRMKHMNRCTIIPLLDDENQNDTTAIVTPEELLASLEAIDRDEAEGIGLDAETKKQGSLCVTRMLKVCG